LVRRLGRAIPPLLQQSPGTAAQGGQQALGALLDEQLAQLKQELGTHLPGLDDFNAYLALLRQDALENLEPGRHDAGPEADDALEAMLARYRANLLVDNRHQGGAPAIYDDDPTLLSLFGGIEAAAES